MDAVLSKDGKRLCVYSSRKLKIIDIPDGSTSIQEMPGDVRCETVARAYESDKLLIWTDSVDDDLYRAYLVADFDGNIDKAADGNKIWISDVSGKFVLANTGENYDTIVIDSSTGKQIRYIVRSDDESKFDISDISRNGNIALASVSNENSTVIRLIDTQTGQRVDCKIKSDSSCIPELVDNDQKNRCGLFRCRRPHEDAHRRLQVEYPL